MGKTDSEIQQLFYRGEYRQVLKKTVDAPTWAKKEQDISYVIGALSFAGRMEEAQLLANIVFQKKNTSSQIRTRFFLGIGYTRLSEYSRALSIFTENFRLVRDGRMTLENKFFIYQGVSFYRFFCGKFAAAKRASDVAFEAAFAADDLYGKALSTDIRSHILIGLGDTSTGFELRQRAEHFGKLLGNKSLLLAFKISTMVDRARLGLAPKESLAELTQAIETLKPEDNYSRGNFLLELARQLTLRGQVTRAGQVLDQASELIYAHQNRWQETTLNLRYGYLLYCSGDYSRGLSSIRAAKRTVHPVVDRVLQQEALGLELKLVQALKMDQQAEKIKQDLEGKLSNDSNFVHRRIVARASGENLGAMVRKGLDPLGDLLDLIKTDPERAIDPILHYEYLEFFYDLLPVERQRPTLYVDLRPGLVLAFERGEVSAIDGLTSLLRKVLRTLSSEVSSKEDIFLKAWGFKYDSLRHDTVIYAAINSVRKLLGNKAHWLETVENGYRLSSQVVIIFHKSAVSEEVSNVTSPSRDADDGRASSIGSGSFENSLNFRQLEILGHLAKKKFIDVQQCKKMFQVSDITASRDLSSLTGAGHVVRIGRGRATKYSLGPSSAK